MKKFWKYLRILFSVVLWRQVRVALVLFFEGNVAQILKIGALGRNSRILPSAQLAFAENIFIGDGVGVNRWVILWAGPNSKIIIGDKSGLGPGTFVTSDIHGKRAGIPYMGQRGKEADIVIGSDVWAGANCTILPGVTIPDGAVIGAGAVVTKDIPENAIAVGNPAHVVKYRTP